MIERITSKARLQASEQLATFIECGGDAKEFMRQFHPEDAVLINDEAFAIVYNDDPTAYSISQADQDCLAFLDQCSLHFLRARKEMGQHLLQAFDAYVE